MLLDISSLQGFTRYQIKLIQFVEIGTGIRGIHIVKIGTTKPCCIKIILSLLCDL